MKKNSNSHISSTRSEYHWLKRWADMTLNRLIQTSSTAATKSYLEENKVACAGRWHAILLIPPSPQTIELWRIWLSIMLYLVGRDYVATICSSLLYQCSPKWKGHRLRDDLSKNFISLKHLFVLILWPADGMASPISSFKRWNLLFTTKEALRVRLKLKCWHSSVRFVLN